MGLTRSTGLFEQLRATIDKWRACWLVSVTSRCCIEKGKQREDDDQVFACPPTREPWHHPQRPGEVTTRPSLQFYHQIIRNQLR
jgi:hypothetical protein